MIETAAIAEVTAPPAVYRAQEPQLGNTGQQGAAFAAALENAQSAQATDPGLAGRYVRVDGGHTSMASGDGAFSHLGRQASSMSAGFRGAINEAFGKLSHLDFTEPSAMVTVMEVQLGVFSAAHHVQFATKVADFSVHGLTTLFRNQG